MAIAGASCSHEKTWTVQGTVTGAADSLLVLEESHNGVWSAVDSATLDNQGSYTFKRPVAGYPDIYRLAVGNERIYFPVDSTDNLTVKATYPGMAANYTMEGSASTAKMTRVNSLINDAVAQSGVAAVNDSVLKRELAEVILEDASGVVAYYIINKEIAGHPLYDPMNRSDLRVIGAVANALDNKRADDPRALYMQQLFLAARRAQSNTVTRVEAPEIGFPDLELTSRDGQPLKLSSITANGKPVILNFTAYAAEGSPAINIALSNVYRNGGVDIYQVSADTDEFLWREASASLPWHTVLIMPKDGNLPMAAYNVTTIPTTFIIDQAGMLRERVTDLGDLQQLVNKYK